MAHSQYVEIIQNNKILRTNQRRFVFEKKNHTLVRFYNGKNFETNAIIFLNNAKKWRSICISVSDNMCLFVFKSANIFTKNLQLNIILQETITSVSDIQFALKWNKIKKQLKCSIK